MTKASPGSQNNALCTGFLKKWRWKLFFPPYSPLLLSTLCLADPISRDGPHYPREPMAMTSGVTMTRMMTANIY